MLYDAEFLKRLDEQIEHTTYVRIQALTLDERPVETLQGRTTSGSINLDGKSAIRRSCSLSFIAELPEINDYYWTFKRKFKVEIGLENKIDSTYPSIIWFPMGVFFITSFSATVGTNNCSISIQGKDKMCLLNGELGGVINAETDFGSVDETDIYGETTNTKLEIREIIENLIYTYAQEPLSNIIIQDLDVMGLEQLDYKYDDILYLVRPAISKLYTIPIFENAGVQVYIDGKGDPVALDSDVMKYDSLITAILNIDDTPTQFTFEPDSDDYSAERFCAAKITYGDAIGYRTCPLVYAGDLIAKAGDTVTSVLDKIVKMLGEFEYFYDLDGHFVFRRKKSFINTVWTPQVKTAEGDEYYNPYYYSSPYSYVFQDNKLITNISNAPKLDTIKNDYTVWGERTGVGGSKIPIHARFAIDVKPNIYVSVAPMHGDTDTFDVWTTEIAGTSNCLLLIRQNPWLVEHASQINLHGELDWRELIYQMAREYRRYNRTPKELEMKDYTKQLSWRNPQYRSGHTGYEQYYTDMEGFWRSLYHPYKLTDMSADELAEITTFKSYDIDDNNVATNKIYIQGIYRPNSQLITSYPGQAIDQIKLKTNEEIYQLETEGSNPTRVWILNTDYYYYYDNQYHGFALPENDEDYFTIETLKQDISNTSSIEEQRAKLNSCYTLAEPLTSQKIYTYDNREAYLEDNLIIPLMDKFDYVPINYCQQLIDEFETDGTVSNKVDPFYRIKHFYAQDYGNIAEPYALITEEYTGSKYNTYVLDNLNESAHAIWNDLNIIQNLIQTLYENNISNFTYWPQWQSALRNANQTSLLEWLQLVTSAQIARDDNTNENTTLFVAIYLNEAQLIEKISEYTDQEFNGDIVKALIWYVLCKDGYSVNSAELDNICGQAINTFNNLTMEHILAYWRFKVGIDKVLNIYTLTGALDVLRFACGISPNQNQQGYDAMYDFDGNGIIDTTDALLLLRYVLGISDTLPTLNPIQISDKITASPMTLLGLILIWTYQLSNEDYVATVEAHSFNDTIITSASELPVDFWVKYQNTAALTQLLNINETNNAFLQIKLLLKLYYFIVQDNIDLLREANVNAPNYTLFTDIVEKLLPTIHYAGKPLSIHDNWSRYFIYDATNYYPLIDIQHGPIALQKLYGLNNSDAIDLKETIELTPYDIHGEPLYLSTTEQKLFYYTREYNYYPYDEGEKRWWNKAVYEEPYSLNFWLDFLEANNSEIGLYAVSEIGDRPIVVNETNLKSIFYREIPKIIIMDATSFAQLTAKDIKTGYSYVLFPEGYENFFSISSRGISIKNRIDELVYQHTYCAQQINLTSLPIYYLDVNTRIKVVDAMTLLSCDCAIQTLSYSLNYNGTMSISAAKIQPNSTFEREE